MLIKGFTGACKAADRRLPLGCLGAFQSAEWAVVKRLTDTDPVVDQSAKTRGFHTQLDEGPETP